MLFQSYCFGSKSLLKTLKFLYRYNFKAIPVTKAMGTNFLLLYLGERLSHSGSRDLNQVTISQGQASEYMSISYCTEPNYAHN